MNKFTGFLLLDIVVDIDKFLLSRKLKNNTRANIKRIKVYLELLSKYISNIIYLENNDITEQEFNLKIKTITNQYAKRIKGIK